jgi:hypothetical protein
LKQVGALLARMRGSTSLLLVLVLLVKCVTHMVAC